jgi:hypothetical protein
MKNTFMKIMLLTTTLATGNIYADREHDINQELKKFKEEKGLSYSNFRQSFNDISIIIKKIKKTKQESVRKEIDYRLIKSRLDFDKSFSTRLISYKEKCNDKENKQELCAGIFITYLEDRKLEGQKQEDLNKYLKSYATKLDIKIEEYGDNAFYKIIHKLNQVEEKDVQATIQEIKEIIKLEEENNKKSLKKYNNLLKDIKIQKADFDEAIEK